MLQASGLSLYDGAEELRIVGMQIGWNMRMKRAGSQSMALPGETTWFTEDVVKTIKANGGNTVDIHQIRLSEIMPTRNVIDENFFIDWIDKWVSWCTTNELYCILNIGGLARRESSLITWGPIMPSWMWEDYGQPTTEAEQSQIVFDFWDTDNPRQEENRQAFINAWAYIANRYRNNPYVSFNIMNEPLCHTNAQMSTELAQHLGVTYSVLMERVIDGIRATGAGQVVFIDSPYVWGNVQPVNRSNMVWEDHIYVNDHRTLEQWKTIVDLFLQYYVVGFGKPFFLGEFGIDPAAYSFELPDWKAVLAEQVAYLDAKPFVGRHWHQWSTLNGGYFSTFNAEDSQYIMDTVLAPMPVVPHALVVTSNPISGVAILIDGAPFVTPTSPKILEEGLHTVAVPPSVTVGSDVYNFQQWEDGSTNPTRTVELLQDLTISVTYTLEAPIEYTLTVLPVANGATSPAPGTYSYPAGTVVSVQAVPNAGYKLDLWRVDGIDVVPGNPIAVPMDADRTVEPVFSLIPPAQGVLECHAYADSMEIVVPAEIVEAGITPNTPFTENLNVGTYTVKVTIGETVQEKTATITDGQITRLDFHTEAPAGGILPWLIVASIIAAIA